MLTDLPMGGDDTVVICISIRNMLCSCWCCMNEMHDIAYFIKWRTQFLSISR